MEEWKKTEDYPKYSVSNLGRVRNDKTGKIRILDYNRGYLQIHLSKNKKMDSVKIHRLVAITFIPNPENKPVVNHINNIRDDNRVENLEWVNQKENLEHTFKQGRVPNGVKHYNAKLNMEQVKEIRESNLNQRELSEIYNISKTAICLILKNKRYKI